MEYMYNIHPILVHFPVALLFVYSLIKILPFKKWFPKIAWRDIERALLLIGVLGAFAADATGDLAEHIARPNRALVEMHSTFAGISTFLYGFLLAGEIISVFRVKYGSKILDSRIQKILAYAEQILCDVFISNSVAFLGLIAISITGLLGGVMVYGVSVDPIAGMVLSLLRISI
ncbi:MAG: DUF2231 domain-containing protein [bacterium]